MPADRTLSARAARALDAGESDVVVVRSPIAPMHAEARVSSTQVAQALAGHALVVVERHGPWLRLRGGDDYEGWTHEGYVAAAADLLGSRGRAWYDEAMVSLDCTVQGPHGRRRLPLGALLLPGEVVEEGDALDPAALPGRFTPGRDGAARAARTLYEGASYQWGGVTPWGSDCSGFVQAVAALHGLPLPRDAWQQAAEGDAVGAEPTSLEPGDLLFFSDREDGRITHVGMSLGGAEMAHVSLGRGGFAVDRLDQIDDPYVRQLRAHYRHARRPAWPR